MAARGGPFPTRDGFLPVDGGRLYWRSVGDPASPPLLVVHGGPSEHGYLRVLEDLVPYGIRVVFYDQWGCGRSTRWPLPSRYGPASAGQHVERVRQVLRLGRPTLFGHSWGGAVALEAIAQFPRSYRRLVLCGAFPSTASFGRAMRLHLRSLPPAIRRPLEAGETSGRFESAAYRQALRRRRREFSQGVRVLPLEFRAAEARVNRRLLRAIFGHRPGLLSRPTGSLAGWDVRPRLGRVRVPTLLLAGDREAGRFTARELHRLWPRSRLTLIAGAAHLPFYEQRDRFLGELLDFLSPRPRRGTGPDRRARKRA